MDPDETLRQLRALVALSERRELNEYDCFPELFQALDEWLSKGGFPPGDWSPRRA